MKQLNEVARMQQLAGIKILNENQDLSKEDIKQIFYNHINDINYELEYIYDAEQMYLNLSKKMGLPVEIITKYMDKFSDIAEDENPEASTEDILSAVFSDEEDDEEDEYEDEDE